MPQPRKSKPHAAITRFMYSLCRNSESSFLDRRLKVLMTRQFIGPMLPVVVWAAILPVMPVPAAGQTKGQAYTAPRTPDGKPDLQGIWEVLNTAADNVE